LGKKKEVAVSLYAEYEVKVFDPKTGKVIKKVKGKGKTFTQHFARLLALLLFPRGDVTTKISATDHGGVGREFWAPHLDWSPPSYSPATTKQFRVGVGKSDVTFDRTQYDLLDLISWMIYSTYAITDDGTKVLFEVSGSWYNDTGATVTVKEIGMSGLFEHAASPAWVMLARDVITPTDVPAGSTIAVAYKVTIPF